MADDNRVPERATDQPANGKEYIVNGFGGNLPDRLNFPPNPVGDAVIAFTLP